MVRKYQPTPEERDERVNTEHPAEHLIRAVLKAGPHPKSDEAAPGGDTPESEQESPPSR